MSSGKLLFDSLDACLGPGDSRFFGSGYKRVGQHLRHIVADGSTEPGGTVAARAALSYPLDWSRKADGRELRPHLSSIDALVLAASLAEIHLNAARGLRPGQQRRTWLRSADVRAGARPHEDLSDFAVEARLRSTGPARGPYGPDAETYSVYDCRIGGLKVRCTFAHEVGDPARGGPARYVSDEDALGPASERHYGEGYKAHSQHADDVSVELAEQRVRARQYVEPGSGGAAVVKGAEAAYAPSVSLIDCMVSVAQLAQALLYSYDRVDRVDSNTLWMRRISIGAQAPSRPYGGPFDASARVTRTRLLGHDGGSWRVADLTVDDFNGIHGWCSLAHRLPVAAAA
ncbi:AvrD family protein [Streptomyces sp. H27-D2]|uniref:AvrD family protein n=1 Tax=Streptomyces sp. H27-D2 TaxID=3046304 RepID=UPI002DB6CC89|nr:AvrD family protein [Streptomyces sp. H27-D2]MEC4017864.1 AvrD family protein [Streptomyces sp. H27-D2]